VITGRVLDEDGEALARAIVTVQRYQYLRGDRQLTPAGGDQTDHEDEAQEGEGQGDAPWPPQYAKAPGEPRRVQPSRRARTTSASAQRRKPSSTRKVP